MIFDLRKLLFKSFFPSFPSSSRCSVSPRLPFFSFCFFCVFSLFCFFDRRRYLRFAKRGEKRELRCRSLSALRLCLRRQPFGVIVELVLGVYAELVLGVIDELVQQPIHGFGRHFTSCIVVGLCFDLGVIIELVFIFVAVLLQCCLCARPDETQKILKKNKRLRGSESNAEFDAKKQN